MDILALAKQQQEDIVKNRRYLHEHPELSQHEEETVAFVCKKLEEYGVSYINVPKGGVLGFIGGDENSKTVMLRADMDALPVQENPNNLKGPKSCVSKVPGAAHVCGHDSHTAMLLAAAKILQEHKDEIDGRVMLFFERAEEAGGNILYLLRYIYEHKIRVDGVFGLHVKGNLDAGKISLQSGGVNAGGFGFEVSIHGKGGHGSAPDKCNSPIDCFAALYHAFMSIPVKYVSAKEMLSFNFGKVQSGSKRNIIPDQLDFAGGMRFFDHAVGVKGKEIFLRLLDGVCKTYECTYEVTNSVGPTLPLVNNPQCVDIGLAAFAKDIGQERLTDMEREVGSESFSAAQRIYPGAYAFLGIRNEALGIGAPNHSAEFDIDESVLYLGTAMHISYALAFLQNTQEIHHEPYPGSPDDLYREICYKVN